MDFYTKVMALCRKKNISRSRMADEVGISRSTPKDWAEKKSVPQPGTVKKIADYFEVPTSYFFDDNATDIQTVNDNHGIIGNTHAPVTIMNSDAESLTEQETELLNTFRKLSVIKQAQLLVKAAELLEK